MAASLAGGASAAPIHAMAFSPDGTVLAVATGSSVRCHDADSGRASAAVSCGTERALALSFQPRGTLLAVGTGTPGEQGGLRLLDWKTHRWLGSVTTSNDVVTGVAFSPDGTALAASGGDTSAVVYRVEEGGARLSPMLHLTGHSAAVRAVVFTPDGTMLVTASSDRSLKVWAASDRRLLRSFGQHMDAVHALAFRPGAPDRADLPPHCASGGDDRTIRIWQPTIGRMVRIVRGHGGAVLALVFAADGRSLFSAGQEGIVRRIDADSDEVRGEWPASSDWIYSLAVAPDGGMLATGDWAGRVRRWSVSEQDIAFVGDLE